MSERDDDLYIADIRDSIEAILQYLNGDLTYEAFRNNRMLYSAVIREFEIIGEAAGKLTNSVKQKYPEVSWQDLKDFRNILIHEYFGIDLEIVWNFIQQDLPQLYKAIQDIQEN